MYEQWKKTYVDDFRDRFSLHKTYFSARKQKKIFMFCHFKTKVSPKMKTKDFRFQHKHELFLIFLNYKVKKKKTQQRTETMF